MNFEPLTIFYTDDDEEDRSIFREAVQSCGEPVILTLFDNGKALLKHLEQITPIQWPCVLVCDMKMPLMDGLEILRQLKKNSTYSSLPVIILTTSSSFRDIDHAMALGARAFITKPETFREVQRVVDEIIQICRNADVPKNN